MSDELRNQITEAVESWLNSPDDLASNDEMAHQVTEIVMGIVQPVVAARDVAVREATTWAQGEVARLEHQLEGCIQRFLNQAETILAQAEEIRRERQRAETAEAERDRQRSQCIDDLRAYASRNIHHLDKATFDAVLLAARILEGSTAPADDPAASNQPAKECA